MPLEVAILVSASSVRKVLVYFIYLGVKQNVKGRGRGRGRATGMKLYNNS